MIRLKRVRLVNWYAFSDITAPVGTFTLIAGKNGNGKSVLLDAIKLGLYGDTVYNKSTENKGSRTTSSYTRGLLDATAGTYMRPVDKSPNVYTHIVLEMEDVELQRTFILGTIIETDSGNTPKTSRYILDPGNLDDMEHTYEKEGAIYAYSSVELQKKYGLKMMDVRDGLQKFMARTGLHLNDQQLLTFRRKLRSIMSYDPNAKIDTFIRESVLEAKNVDLSKLIKAKENIDIMSDQLTRIKLESEELDKILALFDEVERITYGLLVDEIKKEYKVFLDESKQADEAAYNIETAKRFIADTEEQIENLKIKEQAERKVYEETRLNLNNSNIFKALEEAKNTLREAKRKEAIAIKEKDALIALQKRIDDLIAWLRANADISMDESSRGIDGKQSPISVLKNLLKTDISAAEKSMAVDELKNVLQNCRDKWLSQIVRLQDEITENDKQQSIYRKIIADCNAKKTSFDSIPDYVGLKEEINRAFKSKGLAGEARFACEYVLALKDESWRDAIEGYLRARRYTILVPPEYYDMADDILNGSRYKYAHLFNTKLLMKKVIHVEDDSVVQYLDIKNDVAKTYFNYQLGRFHAVSQKEVRNYENAIAKTGRVSVAMDSYFLDAKRIKFYCLGQESIELNRLRAEKQVEILKTENTRLQESLNSLNRKKEHIELQYKLIDTVNYDAVKLAEQAISDVARCNETVRKLEEAHKQDNAYWELAAQVADLEKSLKSLVDAQGKLQKDAANKVAEIKINESRYEIAKGRCDKASHSLADFEIRNKEAKAKAIADYDQFIATDETGKGGILKETTRNDYVRKLNQQKSILSATQGAYNANFGGKAHLPQSTTPDTAAAYSSRKSRIWIDDLQEIQVALKEHTKRYEDIFKNEFVLTVLKSCQQAMRDLKLINAELKQLNFKSQYAFDVKFVKDGSKFEDILTYAKFLEERAQLKGGMWENTLEGMTEYSDDEGRALEEKMKQIIGEIVKSNDMEQIERFADYRNYMTYEILISNEVLDKAKLSRQSGFNSGAEVQIPYMLILLSALLMIYEAKNNSTRLVFIDEPFAKMDPINVKTMLGFMRKQKLQMIFCAPDKTEAIGGQCEVILPVLRTQPDLMQIGSVEMHKLSV